jgi:hypothetical protein
VNDPREYIVMTLVPLLRKNARKADLIKVVSAGLDEKRDTIHKWRDQF